MADQKSPIILGLRKEYPGYDDIPDEEFVSSIREAHYSDLPEHEFFESMESAFGAPTLPSKPGLGQVLRQTGKTMVSELEKDVKGFSRGMGKGLAIGGLEKAQLPDITYNDLLARGYPPDIAHNIMQQRVSTQSEMSNELTEQAGQAREETARGAAFLTSAVLAGSVEAGVAKRLGKTGLGWLTRHAAAGGVGFGAYEAIRTGAKGGSASDILDATWKGAAIGTVAGPPLAGLLGRFGKTIATVGNIPRYVQEGMSIAAGRQRQALETAAVQFAEKFQSGWITTRFRDMATVFDPTTGLPTKLDPRQIANSIVQRVLGTDAADLAPPEAIETIATKIEQAFRSSGLDPSLSPRAAMPVTDVPLMSGLTPTQPFVPQAARTPAEAITGAIEAGRLRQAVGQPPIEAGLGGLAPEPNVAFPGPISEQVPVITPPTGKPSVPGLETPVPSQAELPLGIEGATIPPATPEMQFPVGTAPSTGSVGAGLRTPLGATPQAVPEAALEPAGRALPPSPGAPPRTPGEDILNRQLNAPSGPEEIFQERKLPGEVKAQAQEFVTAAAESKIQELKKSILARRNGVKSLKSRQDLEQIADWVFLKGANTFKTFSKEMKDLFGFDIKTHLERLYRVTKNKAIQAGGKK